MDNEGRLPVERRLRRRLEALPQACRSVLLRVMTLPQEDRVVEIGRLYADPDLRRTAELLMDVEEDPVARAIVVSELRIMNRHDG